MVVQKISYHAFISENNTFRRMFPSVDVRESQSVIIII
jgi:hypothetical protein